jgi:hypothetical protein
MNMNFTKTFSLLASLAATLLHGASINEAIRDAVQDKQAGRLQAILETHPPDTLEIDHHLSAALIAAISRDNSEAAVTIGGVLVNAGVMTKEHIMQTAAYAGAARVLSRVLEGASSEAVEDLLGSLQGQSSQDELHRQEILSLLQARVLADHAKPDHGDQAETARRQIDD